MAEVHVTWRECPRQKIKQNPAYEPPKPYETTIEVDFPFMLTGEEAAGTIIEAQVDNDPQSWDAFDYTVEILAPDRLAGRYQVEVVMEATVSAYELPEAA